jgi:hypothetical protein
VNRKSRIQNVISKTGDHFEITDIRNSELFLVTPSNSVTILPSLQDTKDQYMYKPAVRLPKSNLNCSVYVKLL